MDRGANGGIAGNDCVVIREYDREVDITGIDNHEISDMKIVDAVGKIITQHGPAIVILQHCAYYGKGDPSIPQCKWSTLVTRLMTSIDL